MCVHLPLRCVIDRLLTSWVRGRVVHHALSRASRSSCPVLYRLPACIYIRPPPACRSVPTLSLLFTSARLSVTYIPVFNPAPPLAPPRTCLRMLPLTHPSSSPPCPALPSCAPSPDDVRRDPLRSRHPDILCICFPAPPLLSATYYIPPPYCVPYPACVSHISLAAVPCV